jgi:hypothetical protein
MREVIKNNYKYRKLFNLTEKMGACRNIVKLGKKFDSVSFLDLSLSIFRLVLAIVKAFKQMLK